MRKNIHPQYHKEAKITCACGNEFRIGATVSELHLEACAACHPLFTGKMKLMDTAGRVDRFKVRLEKAQAKQAIRGGKK